MHRRQTPWKKSRTFGDIFGGRSRRRIPDRIWQRFHSIKPLAAHDQQPHFIVDNPSRDFFFPLTPEDIRKELGHLPRRHWSQITHIWLRRRRKADVSTGEFPLAEFICGSGVRLIVLYPWLRNLSLPLGTARPTRHLKRRYAQYTTDVRQVGSNWQLHWEKDAIRNFSVEQLLYHEIGHHLDWYQRRWSSANRKAVEEFADQYAFERTAKRSIRYRRESRQSKSDHGGCRNR